MRMLKAIDDYFFGDDDPNYYSISDRLWFYGGVGLMLFFFIIGMVA